MSLSPKCLLTTNTEASKGHLRDTAGGCLQVNSTSVTLCSRSSTGLQRHLSSAQQNRALLHSEQEPHKCRTYNDSRTEPGCCVSALCILQLGHHCTLNRKGSAFPFLLLTVQNWHGNTLLHLNQHGIKSYSKGNCELAQAPTTSQILN